MHSLTNLDTSGGDRTNVVDKTLNYPARERLKALFVLEHESLEIIYGRDELRDLEQRVHFYAPPQTRESILKNPAVLHDVEVIFSGWGAPVLDDAFLAAAPNLRAVFYGAGSIRSLVTESFWRSGIVITSAAAANAVPVAEYVLGAVLLSMKHFWKFSAQTRGSQGWGDHTRQVPGTFRSTVGFVSCGLVARRTLELLRMFDMRRLVYCPFLSSAEAEELGAELCSMEEVFERADVVSLHTPLLAETRGLVTGRHFASMKEGATFINTARGAVVRESEMIEVLRARTDVTAVLDVCDPEPADPSSALLTLSNVVLTPHIAGSLGTECQRLGRYMVEELNRFLAGEPLKWQIHSEQLAQLA